MKSIKESLKKPYNGSFALEPILDRSIEWLSCRDRFAMCFTNDLEGFYFSHDNSSNKVIAFVNKTEDILGISYSTFEPTNRDYATWVSPSPFWKDHFIKRSFFTLLLRAGHNYNYDNYEEAMYDNPYFKDTKQAVMRFLFGFTDFYTQHWELGWMSTFVNKSTEDIRRRLISLNKIEDNSIIGRGSLWR